MSLVVPRFRLRRQIRRLPVVLGLLFIVAAIAVAVAAVSVRGDHGEQLLDANDAMESQLLRQAVIVEGAAPVDAARFERLSHAFDQSLSDALTNARTGSPEQGLLRAQSALADRWRAAATRAIIAPRDDRRQDAVERARLVDAFAERNATLHGRVFHAQVASERGWRLAVLLVAVALAALVAAAGGIAALGGWRRHAARVVEDKHLLLEDRRHRREQQEFGRALQGTRTQREAQRMLKRQLERGLPDSVATVLNRDNSENRLEAVTAVRADSPLATTLADAEPDDCLAVRRITARLGPRRSWRASCAARSAVP
jgi:hypothetical protein